MHSLTLGSTLCGEEGKLVGGALKIRKPEEKSKGNLDSSPPF